MFRRHFRAKGFGEVIPYIEGTIKETKLMVRQEEPFSCSAACVRQIAKDFGVDTILVKNRSGSQTHVITEDILRSVLRTDENGTKANFTHKVIKQILSGISGIEVDRGLLPLNASKELANQTLERLFVEDVLLVVQVELILDEKQLIHTEIVDKYFDNVVTIRDPEGVEQAFGKNGFGKEGKVHFDDFQKIWEPLWYDHIIIKRIK